MTKRPDGRYMTQIDVGRDPATGKRVRKTIYGKTKKEVDEKVRKLRHDLDNGLDMRKKMPTLSEWVDKYISVYCVKDNPRSAEAHSIAARHIKEYFKNMPLDEVRKSDIATFAASISDKSASYTNKIRSLLCNAFSAAVDDRIIPMNPAQNVKFPHAESGTHRALTAEEIAILNKAWPTAREGIGSLIMLYCGLRIGEYMALTWADIDLSSAFIHVHSSAKVDANYNPIVGSTKTKASIRDVPIPQNLVRILSLYKDKPTIYLHSGTESLVRPTTVERHFQIFYSNIGISIRPHDLRHTYATMLYDAGVDIKTAQSLLGHSNAKMTMEIYTHLSESRKTLSIDKLTTYIDSTYTTESV